MSVYFLKFNDLLKIGYSANLANRVQTIVSGAPGKVDFVGHMPGDREVERHLHQIFEPERFSGEWFVASDRLKAFVATIALPDMPAAASPTTNIERAVLNEEWREVSARFRKAAAHAWPEASHAVRKANLAAELGWGTRRVRALYEAAPGMTLRQHEAQAVEAFSSARLLLDDAEAMSPAPLSSSPKTSATRTPHPSED